MDKAGVTVEVVIDDTGNVAAVGAVSGVITTGLTRFMALLTTVV